MTPTAAGRFCYSCNKEVIDFSILSDEEIKNYFIANAGKPTCGHFRKTQLERITIQLPSYFFRKKIPAWQKYLVVFLICFGSNLFSVDVTVGNNQGLYAQTLEPVKKKKKKKKYIKLKLKKIDSEILNINTLDGYTVFNDLEQCTLGSIVITPERQLPEIPSILNKTLKIDSAETKDTTAVAAEKNFSTKEEKEPNKKPFFPKPEFVLPAAFYLRGKRKNTKKQK